MSAQNEKIVWPGLPSETTIERVPTPRSEPAPNQVPNPGRIPREQLFHKKFRSPGTQGQSLYREAQELARSRRKTAESESPPVQSPAEEADTKDDPAEQAEDLNDSDVEEVLSLMEITPNKLKGIGTKELNFLIKKKGVTKKKAKTLKAYRRTLKNRGYAAKCREKRMDEEERLLNSIAEYEKKFLTVKEEIDLFLDELMTGDYPEKARQEALKVYKSRCK